ncbi:FHA domain-containing protein [Nocardia mexicana]|uniref:FHA domain-containing protein n=1 Tax=Nocardia mexicana TaxID=279262 RepID=A0A370GJZ6_9NOCA|nr:FHA domain-containing protein [Nocardia mexicana]RDI43690.1 FHA domain-containing protein [Nocardia mexicana]
MTATCPEGHASAATDYCDVCGSSIGEAPPAVEQPTRCPACDAPISGRFCEACGHDSALPMSSGRVVEALGASADDRSEVAEAVARQSVWVATVVADRDLYERMLTRKGPDADRVEFPDYYRERRIVLHGNDFLIGKRSVSQGLLPEIDLGIAPVDIGVSRSHARLHLDDGGLTVTDLGSTNGTSLNGSDDLIPPKTPVPLRSGDRIHVGGWTTITVTSEPA